MIKNSSERGITLLITLLLMSVLLGISASLLNVSIKQYQLSGIAKASEMAFQAANAGMECAVYNDFPPSPSVSEFEVPDDGNLQALPASITCMGVTIANTEGVVRSGEKQHFQFSWGPDPDFVCTDVSVYKFSDASGDITIPANYGGGTCYQNTVCTVIEARGYNTACPASGSNFLPRTIERELTQRY